MTIMNAEVPGKHTFTISKEGEIVHKLDPKYLPEGGAGYSESTVASAEVEAMEQTKLRYFPVFDVGDTVAISVDGVKYSLVAYADDGMGGNVGIGDTAADIDAGGGEYGWKLWVASGTARIISIKPCTVSYAVETVHTIDPKYMPKMNPIDDVDNEGVLMYRFNDLLQALRNAGYLATEYDSGLV
jgi:hypothetical protein